MNGVFRWLLGSQLVQSFASREVRHLATAASGFVLSWLVAHQANQSDAASIAQGIFAIIVGLAGYGLSRLNGADTETRVQAAAITGQVVNAPEARAVLAQATAVQKADANSPQTKASLLADLAAGGPK